MELHPDFGGIIVEPGSVTTAMPDVFTMVNLLASGAGIDHPTHVPIELVRFGPVALWESTGSSNRLPFWNTVFDGDSYLYIVHGAVRVEFKEPEGSELVAVYEARTGDLFKLPCGFAHRTYSGDGKRRITLEMLPDNPLWGLRGSRPIEVDHSGRIGAFVFTAEAESVRVDSPGSTISCPRDTFVPALRTLSTWELHLGHNELDGGLVVHDKGEQAILSVPGHSEAVDGAALVGVFRGLLTAMTAQ